jgi:glutathione reductase (NADPH)
MSCRSGSHSLGGGYIAAEFAHIAARVGAEVTIFEQTERMLAQFDPDLVGWLMEETRSLGIEVRLGARVEAIERSDKGFEVHARSGGGAHLVPADLVVHAAGRVHDLAERAWPSLQALAAL